MNVRKFLIATAATVALAGVAGAGHAHNPFQGNSNGGTPISGTEVPGGIGNLNTGDNASSFRDMNNYRSYRYVSSNYYWNRGTPTSGSEVPGGIGNPNPLDNLRANVPRQY